MTGSILTARLRRVAAWRPGHPPAARVVKIRCRYCQQWRPPRLFRPGAPGCRRCVSNV
ncbi:hypothetical protein [Paractinoplanes globisporus]|uniref:Uncharacterized protein n=1 Tax=Paractinoplanes globisporus TaxID=113565 RepID=A0ABW6WK20_9ACTN|nr:hypothetical protein [Actinoplanes globisporus]